MNLRAIVLFLLCAFSGAACGADAPRVVLLKTPHGGLQPQAVMDGKGVMHLIYFKGEPSAGDLFYVVASRDRNGSPSPIRVKQPTPAAPSRSARFRGGQLALGNDWAGPRRMERLR